MIYDSFLLVSLPEHHPHHCSKTRRDPSTLHDEAQATHRAFLAPFCDHLGNVVVFYHEFQVIHRTILDVFCGQAETLPAPFCVALQEIYLFVFYD